MALVAPNAKVKTAKKAAGVSNSDRTVAAANATSKVEISEEEQRLAGTLSDKLEYVGYLADPRRSHEVPRVDPKTDQKITLKKYEGYGYAFKALQDMDIPDFGKAEGISRKNKMAFTDANGSRHVKAGETFYLTPFEAGALFSRTEFASTLKDPETKEDIAVMTYKSATTSTAKVHSAKAIPTANLQFTRGVTLVYCSERYAIPLIKKTGEKTKQDKDVWEIAGPQFEKWSSLLDSTSRVKPASKKSNSLTERLKNDRAQAFKAALNAAKANKVNA